MCNSTMSAETVTDDNFGIIHDSHTVTGDAGSVAHDGLGITHDACSITHPNKCRSDLIQLSTAIHNVFSSPVDFILDSLPVDAFKPN